MLIESVKKSKETNETSQHDKKVSDQNSEVEYLRKQQQEDETLKEIFVQLSKPELQNEYKEYFISPVNNILYHKHNDGIYEIQQLVVPECRRNQILEMAHSSFLLIINHIRRHYSELNRISIGRKLDNKLQSFVSLVMSVN